jgi:hypothetical protein
VGAAIAAARPSDVPLFVRELRLRAIEDTLIELKRELL